MSPRNSTISDSTSDEAVDFGAASAIDETAVDFSGVSGFEVIPNGKYPATLSKFEFAVAQSGFRKVKLEFTLTDEAGEYEGRKAWADLSLKSSALWKLKKYLCAMGVPAEDFGPNTNLSQMISELVGRECLLTLGSHMYQGPQDAEPREFQDIVSIDSIESNALASGWR